MRLIDVENYCEHICRCNKEKCDKGKCPIHNAPTIEAVPVVHGEWKYENYTWHCGVCGFHPFKGYIPETPGFNICPNCGASMNGGTQNSYRNRIIDEFAQKAIERLEDMGCEAWRRDIMAIAEEMKGGTE